MFNFTRLVVIFVMASWDKGKCLPNFTRTQFFVCDSNLIKHFDNVMKKVIPELFWRHDCSTGGRISPSAFTGCKANLKKPIIRDKIIEIQTIDKICLYVPFKINLLSAKWMRQTMPTESVQDSGMLLSFKWGLLREPCSALTSPTFPENHKDFVSLNEANTCKNRRIFRDVSNVRLKMTFRSFN